MKVTTAAILRGLASHADDHRVKVASLVKSARSRRWLEDSDLIKLCETCKTHGKKRKKRKGF